jgi:hypothetical protein
MQIKLVMGRTLVIMVAAALAAAGGCSSNSTPADGGASGSFTPPTDPGRGAIRFAASGEILALTGYAFPPVNDGAPAFVDGWEVRFARLLVTFDKLKISSNADVSPGDQSLTGAAPGAVGGGLVAEVDGPWAVDLARGDPAYLEGKGDPGVKAVPIAVIKNQNKNGGQAFATDGTRYAFGFDIVTATAGALKVNLEAPTDLDYAEMVQDQCAVMYIGTATFKGGTVAGHTDCNAGHESWPKVVDFRFCFKSPTTYINCQNPDNTGTALTGEENQRGIALSASQSVLAQVTVHTDHPFWDSVLHESPPHFDQFAARVVGTSDAGVPTVTLDMTKGVDFTAYTDALGNPVSWRYCIDPDTTVHDLFTGVMAFDRQNVPRTAGSDAAAGLRDTYDFATYNQSTQGHLNADGLCAVQHNYPSPN